MCPNSTSSVVRKWYDLPISRAPSFSLLTTLGCVACTLLLFSRCALRNSVADICTDRHANTRTYYKFSSAILFA